MQTVKRWVLNVVVFILILLNINAKAANDTIPENVLLNQRSIGGWYKNIGIGYTKTLSAAEKAALIDDKFRNDATIDNNATNAEIRYLARLYKETGNKEYLTAAENGIRYLLKAQYKNGGWPQFYPDVSIYRSQITYNDNAMINTMNVLNDVALRVNNLDVINGSLVEPSAIAVKKGIDCILKTQVKVNGKLTAWCAQYDHSTMKPAKARAFELVSLSGDESVAIVAFLMKINKPSIEIKNAINSAIEWFEKVKIIGYKFVSIPDPSQPKGKDRVVLPDPNSVIWARFYDIETNKPFFCGRDGIKKNTVAEIESERRNGYAWYGTWPETLIKKKYPEWLTINRS
jgi:PelA/Pel-15E family pectate lyase